jgi:hypothetical protein
MVGKYAALLNTACLTALGEYQLVNALGLNRLYSLVCVLYFFVQLTGVMQNNDPAQMHGNGHTGS